MARFIHTADWQMGMTRYFLDEEAQARYFSARLDAITAIGKLADQRGCDFVVVCGDVFESNHVDRQVVVRTLEALNSCPVPVYLLPGNHDPLDAGSVFHSESFSGRKPEHVHVIESSYPIDISPGTQLVGAPWSSKQPLSDLVGQACRELSPEKGMTRILCGHGAVDTLSPDRENPAVIRVDAVEEAIQANLIHYIGLGDRHSVTQVGTSERIWYSGSPEPAAFEEIDPGKVLVVETNPDTCMVEPVQVGTWRFVDKSFEVNSSEDLRLLESWMEEQPGKDRTAVRLALTGTLSIANRSQLETVLDQFGDLFASIRLWDRHTDLAVIPEEHDFSDLSLSGFAGTALDELRGLAAGRGEEAEEAQNALGLLYRLTRSGS